MAHVNERIAGFEPISLSEMDGVKLQDRADTKFIFATGMLEEVLTEMQADYRLLEMEGTRGTQYRSLYFDTPDLRHYRDHHNRRTFRSKVRFREYVGSDLVFFEVKRKTGRGRTDKARLRVSGIPDGLTQEQQRFAQSASGKVEELVPTLWNHFTRYTFVHKSRPERLTMDIDLRFAVHGIQRPLGDIVVAELKQERADRSSPFARIMRERNIRPAGMSKYCIGMLLLEQPVKYNSFKEVLLKLERLRKAA